MAALLSLGMLGYAACAVAAVAGFGLRARAILKG